ncbi:MAG: response regulator [Kofleriaceae bacterium]
MGQRVLVVDDDEVSLRAYSRGFEREGWIVETARDGCRAIELVATFRLALVVLDLRLPDVWGIDLISRFRAVGCDVPTVLVSGYATVATTVEAMQAGALHVFFKPVMPIEILRSLERSSSASASETPTLARAQSEHIWRVFADSGRNVSLAARRLGIHRQALQRRLRKNIPRL